MQPLSLGEKEHLLSQADPINKLITLKSDFIYHCPVCRVGFYFKPSLKEHLERKSFLIKYDCKQCIKKPFFYNRCQFWLHVKEHSAQAVTFAKVNIATLPKELLLAELNCPSQASPSYSCPSCNVTCFSPSSRENHLTLDRLSCACPLCHLICPSSCSLELHERMHLKTFPFICPECGNDAFQDFTAFEYHCKIKCLHYSRKLSCKCPICKVHISTQKTLIVHLVNNHCKKVYFCKIHLKYFKSEKEIELHKLAHNCKLSPNYSCPLCDSFLHSSKFLITHMEEHFESSSLGKGLNFHCFHCTFASGTKSGLKAHLLSEHKYFACQFCSNLFEHKIVFEKHKAICIAHRCRNCNEEVLSGEDLLKHGEHHLEEGMWVCLLCDNKAFKSKLDLMDHLAHHTKRMSYPLTCCHCNHSYQDDTNYLLHLKLLHRCFGLHCSRCEETFESTSQLENHHVTEGHSLKIYSCRLCDNFESTFIKDVIQHLIEQHHIVQDAKIKAHTKSKVLTLTNYFLSQSLPPMPFGSLSSSLNVPDSSHLTLANELPKAFSCQTELHSPSFSPESTQIAHKASDEVQVSCPFKAPLLNGSHSPSHIKIEPQKTPPLHYKNGLSNKSSLIYNHFKLMTSHSNEKSLLKPLTVCFKIKSNVLESSSHQVNHVDGGEPDGDRPLLLGALGLTSSKTFSCRKCDEKYPNLQALDSHMKNDHYRSKRLFIEDNAGNREYETCHSEHHSQIIVERKRLKT